MNKLAVCLLASTLPLAAQAPRRLTLVEAEDLALKSHPAITAARFTAEAAAQGPEQAGAARFPTVQANLTGAGAPDNTRIAAGAINNPVIYSRLATGFSVNQLLLDFGRTSHLVASSRARAGAEEQNHQATRNAVLLDVDRAYFDALRAKAVLTVASETVRSRELVVDQVRELEKARLKSGLDVSFARVALEEANLLLASSVNQLQAAEANLSEALGLPANQRFELVDQPYRVEPLAVSEFEERALRNRPDLKARRLETDAAREQALAEKTLSYPQVSATAAAGWIPERASALRAGFGAVGVNVNLPFMNGGLYKSRQTEARLRESAALERSRALENRIVRDVKIAWLNVNNAIERVALSERLLEQASQALELAQSRYELGLSSIVEFNQAELARTSAAIQLANAKYDYQLQRAVLNFHAGR
jgi:outer membrane protein